MFIYFLNVFNVTAVRVVFTTLIHSLWLGAIMALLAAVVITLTKKSGPQLRYKLLACLMTLFILCTVYVFFNELSNEMTNEERSNGLLLTNSMLIQQQANITQKTGLLDTFTSFIETHADIIVLMWFVVISLKSIQLISGLRAVYTLKRTGIADAGTYWNKKVRELAVQVNIQKPVRLLQSSLTKVPMVIGHLKPVILFPIGILNALPQNEVEAILLHELAHIARNDFIINLVQQLVEILFFFNPAVIWVSSCIKNERENCCDDTAIAVTHDKKKFIHALVTFQEYNNGLIYAAGFHGSKNHLLNRVKRIVTNNNKTLNNMEKVILTSGIIVTCIATLAFSSGYAKNKKEAVKTATNLTGLTEIAGREYHSISDDTGNYINNNDTLPKQKTTTDSTYKMSYDGDIDGKRIRLKEHDGQIKELSIDGKKIPEDQYGQYKPLVDKIHQKLKGDKAGLEKDAGLLKQQKDEMQKQAEIMQKEQEKIKDQSIAMQKDFEAREESLKQKQLEMEKQLMNKNDSLTKQQAMQMQQYQMKQMEQYKLKQVEFEKKIEELQLQHQQLKEKMKDSLKIKSRPGKQPTYTKPVISSKPVTVKSRASVQSVTEVNSASLVSAASNVKVAPVVSTKPIVEIVPKTAIYPSSTSISDDIIRELEGANIIKTRNNLSFQFTNDELIVNGVKQPNSVHQKLLKKYVTKPGETISISYSNRQ